MLTNMFSHQNTLHQTNNSTSTELLRMSEMNRNLFWVPESQAANHSSIFVIFKNPIGKVDANWKL